MSEDSLMSLAAIRHASITEDAEALVHVITHSASHLDFSNLIQGGSSLLSVCRHQ
jgi:hypothetical protein